MTEQEKNSVTEVRKACRQFAMLYYHFCKTLHDSLGEEQAFSLVQQSVFSLGCDRAGALRARALKENVPLTPEGMMSITDLGFSGWTTETGGLMCPYADAWVTYYDESPWFKRFAALYCDVIDTTNIEVYSECFSHKITSNLAWGSKSCQREYFPSDNVKNGVYSYGKR